MRAVRALRGRGVAAGAVALVFATTARAEEAPPPEQAAPEAKVPARPPLPPEPTWPRLPWARHVEIGGSIALVARPGSVDAAGKPVNVRYRPAVGFGITARWEIFKYLRFETYFVRARHDLEMWPGALGQASVTASDPLTTIAFGGRLAPTVPFNDRTRIWASVGIGYDRFDFPRMSVTDPGKPPFMVRERGESFAEIPLGVGMSFDLIPRWLTFDVEVTGAYVYGQDGASTQPAQAIDSEGRRRMIGGLPKVELSVVQSVGLSLVL